MTDLLKLLLGFLPWIAFGILAGHSLLRLEIAIAVCFAITIITGHAQLRKGYVLTWGALLFFGGNLILVVALKNIWVMTHMGILAPLTLFAVTWASLVAGKPFVLQYARESAPKERWDQPEFMAGCRSLTIMWGWLFTCSTLIAVAQYKKLGGPEWLYGVMSWGVTVFGIAYAEWYKSKKKPNPDSEAEGANICSGNAGHPLGKKASI